MENEVQQQIEKRLAELPEDVRRAILSADLEQKVQDIGAKHQLHIDQIGTLGDEVMLVMLGFSDPDAYRAALASELKVPAESAGKIADDVVEQIFMPIRDSMKKFMEERAAAAAIPKTPAAPLTMPGAERMLAGKTVVSASPAPNQEAQKPISKADPYREPVE